MIHQRSIFYRFLSGFMALWMLVVSLGVTVDMHFCQHHLLDFKIWGKANGCGMEKQIAKCSAAVDGISRPKCCDQKTHQLYFDQTNAGAQQVTGLTDIHHLPFAILPAWEVNWSRLIFKESQSNIPTHGPPWLDLDRTIRFASLLC